ncbi:EAL domain-containing protein [Legionella sp. CNM-4043-24]|uniref:EAL domain-containing protein n=1 Tax=Legionella sp. CNM-4043-24 TaxID=3421646 RepID=UPI00403A9364
MNLSKKIALWVLVVWFIACAGMIALSFQNARSFYIGQMQHNTEETATVLASALESHERQLDKNHLRSMMQRRIDHGDTARIDVRDAGGSVDSAMSHEAAGIKAPALFASLTAMPMPTASIPVIRNGQPDGVVEVTADNHKAIESLWTYSLQLLTWSLISLTLASALVLIFVSKLLNPLRKTTSQARNLLNDEYNIQSAIPATPELRDLTLAMNKMVRKVQALFQEQSRQVEVLRQQAFQDPLTGLGNRRFFLHQVTALISDVEDFVPYYLLFIAVDGLRELNEKEGYVQGDKTIIEAHKAISSFIKIIPASCIARVGGSQFGILVLARDADELTNAVVSLQQNLAERLEKVGHCKAYIGGAPCRFLQPLDSLLSEADKALQIARTGKNAVHIFHDAAGLPSVDLLDDLLNNGRLALYWQCITNNQRVLHRKLYARIISSQGEEFGTGTLLPIAEQAGLAWRIDDMILKTMNSVDPQLLEPFSLTLSSNTILDKENLNGYLTTLSTLPGALRRNIRIDVSEDLMMKSPDTVKACIMELQKLGVGAGIDQAGIHFGSMDYLEDLPVHYFKLHASIVKDLVDNESKDAFIRHFTVMAKTLEIPVIATQVENEEQWAALNKAGVVWGQGRYLASVEPVPLFEIPAVSGESARMAEASL